MSFAGTQIESVDVRPASERTTLRDLLRSATAAEHCALDHEMAHLVLSRRADLIRFLLIHLSARRGIEAWLAANTPPGWELPEQTTLIADDLQVLGVSALDEEPVWFGLDAGEDWMGPAYVIAGSHLGNRLLLAQCGADLPANARGFLTGEAMQDYWKRLRCLLSESPGPDGGAAAIRGAHAAFAHFRACIAQYPEVDLAAA